jgi:hypothetical protein
LILFVEAIVSLSSCFRLAQSTIATTAALSALRTRETFSKLRVGRSTVAVVCSKLLAVRSDHVCPELREIKRRRSPLC